MNKNNQYIIFFLIFIIVVFIIIYNNQQSKESYIYQNDLPYSKLACSYSFPQLLSPCIAKKCANGPYMYSSNPQLKEVCDNVDNYELAQIACGKAFNGQPIQFDYSSLSNAQWENDVNCNCNNDKKVLCPL